jgi:hypothetical protein
MFGLVQAIVQRSLAAGFDLLEMSREAMEASGPDEIESPLTLSEKLAQSSMVQKANSLLQKVPGLSGFLRKQADTIWEEGVDAIFTGDLYLGIFSREELEAGLDIFNQTLGGDIIEGADLQDETPLQIPEEKVKDLVLRLDDYVTDLFTPERLDRFRRRLRSIVNSPDYPEKWLAFRLMLLEYMADEDVMENEKRFFISALLGEMRVAGAAMRQV